MEIKNVELQTKVGDVSQEQFLIFVKAKAIVEIYEAASVIDNNLDNVNFVSTLWDQANDYQMELALEIVKANRNDKITVPFPYSVMSHAYDAVTYREVLCDKLSGNTRDMVKEQVEGHEHELPFEIVTFMNENGIEL